MAYEQGQGLEDLGLEPQAFEALERDFQDVLGELAGDQSLERFRVEYEKLHKALKISHENEKKLLKKCKELNTDIVGNAAKVQTALKLTHEDSQTITFLKGELDKTFKVLALSKEREDKAKQKIENLHAEIKHLNGLLEQGNSLSSGQNNTVQELIALKDELTKERDELHTKLIRLKGESTFEQDKMKNLEQERIGMEIELKALKKQKMELEEKVQKDEDRKKKIQDELESITKNYEESKKKYDRILDEKKLKTAEKDRLVNELAIKESEKESILKEIRRINMDKEEYEKHWLVQLESKKDLELLRRELDENIVKIKKQNTAAVSRNLHLEKNNDKLRNEELNLRESKQQALKEKDIAKNAITHLDKEVIDTRKFAREDRHILDELRRAREQVQKELTRIENENKKQSDEITTLDKDLIAFEKEISNLNRELDGMEKKIEDLEKEKEKYGMQAAQSNAKYLHSLEEIKLKDNLISEFQKKNIETEAKLKQQQNLYEAVRSDRNLYSKQLTETQDEIAEIKRRYKIVNHQISQLKEEIDAKEVALAKEHFEHKKKDKTIEEQGRTLEENRKINEEKDEKLKNFDGEIGKLSFIIKESEKQRNKLKKEYEIVVAGRDILGTHLIRRNDESALLYEKIKIQQQTLAKGEAQFREREEDIELLQNKINDLMRELKIIRREAKSVPGIKEEIHNLEKELIDEKLNVKALSEELENPMNQERYRKLEGTDCDSYEMSTKIETLQKRLISKTEELVEKEVIIQQKEKNIQELREIMNKQPGVEEAKQISKNQQNLKNKTRQMKAMAAELNMYQAQVNEYKYEIDKIRDEIKEVNRKYYEQKKREKIEKEMQAHNQPEQD